MLIILYIAVKWVINVLAIFVVTHTITGVTVDSWKAAIVAALTLLVLNASIKPIIFMLTLPLNVASLGIFTLVINGLIFLLASKMVKGLHVVSFWCAFWAAVIFSMISIAFRLALGPRFSFMSIFSRIYRRLRPRHKGNATGDEDDADHDEGSEEEDGEDR